MDILQKHEGLFIYEVYLKMRLLRPPRFLFYYHKISNYFFGLFSFLLSDGRHKWMTVSVLSQLKTHGGGNLIWQIFIKFIWMTVNWRKACHTRHIKWELLQYHIMTWIQHQWLTVVWKQNGISSGNWWWSTGI